MNEPRLALRTRLRGFARGEDGSMSILFLMLIVVMLLVAGMGVDIAQHEERRALVQSSLDRAVLASASLDQTGDAAAAKAIVQDYFTKSGVNATLGAIDAQVAINSRSVCTTAQATIGTFFMRLGGIDTLAVPASSCATESAQDIEIVLVLDVSYSMIYNIQTGQPSPRLTNLQAAAKNFVSTVLANDRDQRVSIAIVPFNGQVNLGSTLFDKFNDTFTVTDQHGVAGSFCIDMPGTAYNALAIPTTTPLPQAGHFDAWGDTRTRDANYTSPQAMGSTSNSPFNATMTAALTPVCRTAAGNAITPPLAPGAALAANAVDPRIATLQTAIGNLTASGFTSINLGMKWGALMLDPSMRPVLTAMGRPNTWPYAYDRANTKKIIVLMSDGEHQASHYLNAGYRTGDSPIWRRNGTGVGEYSIFFSGRVNSSTSTTICNSRPYWVPSRGEWHSRPWGGTVPLSTACYNPTATFTDTTRQTWPAVWSSLQMNWVAHQLYARGLCKSGLTGMSDDQTCRNREYLEALIDIRGPSTGSDTLDSSGELTEFAAPMDTQLQQTCAQVKDPVPASTADRGATIYTIAFEAPTVGQQQLAQCASSASHYFYVNPNGSGLSINDVFGTIAAQINALKLVQ